jgi:hypothetical protein
MLDEDQMARYKTAAEAAVMSMRELVVHAMEAALAERVLGNAELEKQLRGASDVEQKVEMLTAFIGGHSVRLQQHEKELAALQHEVSRLKRLGNVDDEDELAEAANERAEEPAAREPRRR